MPSLDNGLDRSPNRPRRADPTRHDTPCAYRRRRRGHQPTAGDKLRSAGYEVTLFEDGEACWNHLERIDSADDAPPDLLILDVMMPKMDGFRILGRINESETLRDLPVLMLTARSRETDVVRGLELGATDYVAKPFSVSELAARADKLIGRP